MLLSYVKFNLSGVSTPISKATLNIYANSNLSAGVQILSVADSSWSEATITYNTAPPTGAQVGASGAIVSGTWISIDVTPLITGNGLISLAIVTSSSTAVNFSSRENVGFGPQLIIQ